MKRRLVLASALAGATWAVAGTKVRLPLAESLQGELAAALRAKTPLVVMVSLEGCIHCKMVREQHLVPLQSQSGQAVVQIDMRSQQLLVDFSGFPRTHDQVARSWGVDAAPTLLFFGREGREVALRLRGASIPDFYGAYLEQRLEVARRQLDH